MAQDYNPISDPWYDRFNKTEQGPGQQLPRTQTLSVPLSGLAANAVHKTTAAFANVFLLTRVAAPGALRVRAYRTAAAATVDESRALGVAPAAAVAEALAFEVVLPTASGALTLELTNALPLAGTGVLSLVLTNLGSAALSGALELGYLPLETVEVS